MQIRNLTILLLLLISVSNAFSQEEQLVPTGDLSTPKEAVFQHLYYLDEETFNDTLAAEALIGLDKNVTEEIIELSHKLHQIYDGKGLYVRVDLIPDIPDYIDTLTDNAVFVPFPKELPQVYLIKPTLGSDKVNKKRAKYWRYSPETLEAIPQIHRTVYPLGSHFLLNLLPKGGGRYFGLKLWQYVGVLFLVIISFVLHFFSWRLINVLLNFIANSKLGKGHFDNNIINTLSRYLSLIVVTYIIYVFVPVLTLPVSMLAYVLMFMKLFMSICTIYLFLSAIDLGKSYFKKIVDETESKSDDQLLPIFIKTLKGIVVIGGVLYVLSLLGVDVTALLAGLSIGGLALALAAQDSVKNLIGSVMIYIDKPFKIGDFIKTGDILGTVEEIGFRSSRIRTVDTTLISVPNGSLVDMVVDNLGALKMRRLNTTIGVAYYTPPHLIEAFIAGLKEIKEVHPMIDNNNFIINLSEMNASSIDVLFIVYFNTTDYMQFLKFKEEVILAILRLAESLDVHIAFPSTSLYIETMPERKGQMPDYDAVNNAQIDTKMQDFITDFKGRLDL